MTRRTGIQAVAVGLAWVLASGCVSTPRPPVAAGPLQRVASFPDRQVTGVAVSEGGRVFVCFPLWDPENYQGAVAEVLPDGSVKPYPDVLWNAWRPGSDDSAGSRFVCVQSVVADGSGGLWVLDPAAPGFEGPVAGGAKLVHFDLSDDSPQRVYLFDADTAPPGSYLNDVRIDRRRGFAYITDSGLGAIVVVNLATGEARRVLDDHLSTAADPQITLLIGGRPWRGPNGRTPQIHADGIALSPDGDWLYYHALTGYHSFRVPTALLRDRGLPSEALGNAVENLGPDDITDGMLMDAHGYLYLTALQRNAILVRTVRSNQLTRLVSDERLDWPDSLAMGPDGALYITTSQIHLTAPFNGGRSRLEGPYALWRLPLEARPAP